MLGGEEGRKEGRKERGGRMRGWEGMVGEGKVGVTDFL
jgi:hypothetical protein